MRIPDALKGNKLIEVKNTNYVSNTQQLKDFAKYADDLKIKKILFVRPTTKVSHTVIEAGWKIRYLW